VDHRTTDAVADPGTSGRPDSPGAPARLGAAGWAAAARRSAREFKEDSLQDWAAALTYYGILSIFPGLLVLVSLLGLGSAAVTAWNIAKWPVLLIIVSVMFAILYWASPNARHGFRLVSPGSVLAVVLWLIASGLFALYVANFGHYNKVYGSLAAVIIFLIWMWISNTAVLVGAEFNAELERGRAIAGGLPPDEEPFTELRDTRKLPG